jgi:type IV pilus assembly protein PilB
LLDLGVPEDKVDQATVFEGTGCITCSDTGYRGRIALYEVMRFTEPLKEMVLGGASTAELKVAAIKSGMQTLRMAGINKVMEGMTTPAEVLRVTMSD